MHKPTRRRILTGMGAAVVAVGAGVWWVARPTPAPIGFSISPDQLAAARDLLRRQPAFDVHAHPGRSFVDGAEHLSGLVWAYAKLGSFEQDTIADMRAGGLAAAAFAAVADFQTLGLQGEGLVARRDFEPGEAWASYRRQLQRLQSLAIADWSPTSRPRATWRWPVPRARWARCGRSKAGTSLKAASSGWPRPSPTVCAPSR